MSIEDFAKPTGVVLGAAALLAAGFAAGFVVARDPAVVRRLARAVAGGAELLSLALSETREELADLWAEAREDARAAVEETAFARSEAAAATSATVATSVGASVAAAKPQTTRAEDAAGAAMAASAGAAPRRRARRTQKH